MAGWDGAVRPMDMVRPEIGALPVGGQIKDLMVLSRVCTIMQLWSDEMCTWMIGLVMHSITTCGGRG